MKKNILILIGVMLSFNIAVSQTRAEKKALKKEALEVSFNETKELVESGQFEFVADWALPLNGDISRLNLPVGNNVFVGNRVNLFGNSNFVKLNKKDTKVFLPYFGRAFRTTTRSRRSGGLKFDGILEEYEVKYNDTKNKIEIDFITKNEEDQLRYHFIIHANGSTTLNVNSNYHQTIRYQGAIKPLEKIKS